MSAIIDIATRRIPATRPDQIKDAFLAGANEAQLTERFGVTWRQAGVIARECVRKEDERVRRSSMARGWAA